MGRTSGRGNDSRLHAALSYYESGRRQSSHGQQPGT
ncbi:hypothetical protein F441_05089 [Phytophthora nicotianae CJ01A1]|uniref:Uncharacterized protein n=4 Tax=Phytophthora nicotianae TaxID=4792 RepID=W2XZW8_PHYNI|nr:hypothetical protein F443_05088 [Phytophthora nicotianae P1569]ETK91491.1 hypothetical protein L915_04951 [Phytophthora nicotianae]ETP21380.1 hypothetical protein F441_05089 [Phytophthora nicotianae CJ01A1]ETP27938.1 hypothetical protein F442_22778 [Phytophthora nicotianae P10297]ETL44902.1 hypothetical protein L916_04898 [Phytophthora nicotianae]